MPAPPPPPDYARPLVADGAYETRLDLVVADLRRRFAEHGAGRPVVDVSEVPAATTFDDVARHYDQGLARAWTPATDIAPSGFAYRLRAWRAGGQVFAVALIETPDPAGETPFRILLTARSP